MKMEMKWKSMMKNDDDDDEDDESISGSRGWRINLNSYNQREILWLENCYHQPEQIATLISGTKSSYQAVFSGFPAPYMVPPQPEKLY